MTLGESVEGREITIHIFGEGTGGTLIIGGIHGNEPTSASVAENLITFLRNQKVASERVAIIPAANPDGLSHGLRTNKNGVDLNRNFPAANWAKTRKGVNFGGQRPTSEPETAAILKAFAMLKPERVVSIHSMETPCNNYDGPAKSLAEAMSKCNGYAVKENIGYPTPGSLGSWAGIDREIPMITLELRHSMPGEKAWQENCAALMGVIAGQH